MGHYSCPLAGFRAPELAAKEWESMLQSLFNVGYEQLLEKTRITDAETDILIQDLNKAKVVIFDELHTKLNFWQCLPWRLHVIAHHNEDVARNHTRHILQDWENLDQSPSQHHPLTISALTGECGRSLRHFVDGCSRDDCPLLLDLACRLRFTPVTDRTIEGKFSQATHAAGNRSIIPAYISIKLRMPQWERLLKRDASVLEETAELFAQTRKRRLLPSILGLDTAPPVANAIRDAELKVTSRGKNLTTFGPQLLSTCTPRFCQASTTR